MLLFSSVTRKQDKGRTGATESTLETSMWQHYTTENSQSVTKETRIASYEYLQLSHWLCRKKDLLTGACPHPPFPLPVPVPIPKQERKRAQHKHTGHCSRFVTTTNWRLDQRSGRPSFRYRLPSTKGGLPYRAVYSVGPKQRLSVVSIFSFNVLDFVVLGFESNDELQKFPFGKKPLVLPCRDKHIGGLVPT